MSYYEKKKWKAGFHISLSISLSIDEPKAGIFLFVSKL